MSGLLDQAWAAWQCLPEDDRERFVRLLREAYAQPRRRLENGPPRRRLVSFDEIDLGDIAFEGRPEPVRSGAELTLPEMTWE